MSRRSDPRNRDLPGWLTSALILGTMAAVALAELSRPLRRERDDKVVRDARNLAVAGIAAVTVSLAERPVVAPLTHAVQARNLGLVKQFRLPVAVELFLSVLLLDYTLYLWHYLMHRVPFMWRFHRPHHADIDLDGSTALRFHPGELLLSVPWRAAQVRLLGISPRALSLWQTLTLMEILFHHSNVRLPHWLERWLCRIIVTPRMHGIHHSVVRGETDSNWSTIFSWPDYLHGTIRLNVPQQAITIGIPDQQDPKELTLETFLALPFKPQRPVREPVRAPLSIPRTTLAK